MEQPTPPLGASTGIADVEWRRTQLDFPRSFSYSGLVLPGVAVFSGELWRAKVVFRSTTRMCSKRSRATTVSTSSAAPTSRSWPSSSDLWTVRPAARDAAALAERLNTELRRDGWSLVDMRRLLAVDATGSSRGNPLFRRAELSLRTSAVVLSSAWMHQEIERIEAAIETDPALAIGTAKEMVETCCKHIAEALKVELPANPDMPVLVKAVLKGLRLVPENIPEVLQGGGEHQRTLRSLSQITQGLAELRKLYGTGHGRAASHRGLDARHARLAVASAAAFVEFVVATYKVRRAEMDQAA